MRRQTLFFVCAGLFVASVGLAPAHSLHAPPLRHVWPALAASSSQIAAPKFSSAYSDTEGDHCKPTVSGADEQDGGDTPQRCAGHGGYSLLKTYSAIATYLSVEDAAGKFSVPLVARSDCLQSHGRKIEWRLADGKPFAVILRVGCYKAVDAGNADADFFAEKNKTGEFLLVRGLKGYEFLKTEVDARQTPNPNESARAAADGAYLGKRS